MNTARLQTPSELEPTQHGYRIPAPPANIVRKPLQADPVNAPADDVVSLGSI